MDNPKIDVGTNRFGKCLIANVDISKDEIIAEFDGDIFEAEKASSLPKDLPRNVFDHAIQFEEQKWRDSNGIARYSNHSCDPNCGIKGLFTIVAMKDVRKGEELVWDYDMTEDSDWKMNCLCNSPLCRKIIGSFSSMPENIRKKYQGYISDWLVGKYHL